MWLTTTQGAEVAEVHMSYPHKSENTARQEALIEAVPLLRPNRRRRFRKHGVTKI